MIARLAERGCDLQRPRQVGFDASSMKTADAVVRELQADGWDDPVIFVSDDEWTVSTLGKYIVVSEASIAELRGWAEAFARRLGVTDHGWQATLDPGMNVE